MDMSEMNETQPKMDPLTPEEMEAFLSRARAQGRMLTDEEKARVYGAQSKFNQQVRKPQSTETQTESLVEMPAAPLDSAQLVELERNFFPEFEIEREYSLVQGILFDFDHTLAQLTRPLNELMQEGAKNAEAYMRSTGMTFPENFWENIIEARRFALKKSVDEQEEHIANDAMSFLLQFFGYPASKMDPAILQKAVDIFYASEMVAWKLRPGVRPLLEYLDAQGYKLAVVANYSCDRVFQRIIDYLGIRPYLDMCICSASVEYRKPDTKLFQLVLDHWDVMPYEVVMVGDDLQQDIAGGIALGTMTVQIHPESDQIVDAQVVFDNEQVIETVRADAVIDQWRQMPDIIEAWR